MTNFSVNFTNAWWLLLLIPAFGLTLFSYFKLNKKYRCTRNRVVPTVLHLIIMVLSIALLAGFTIDYFVPNAENEVIILVDSSYTAEDSERESDKFIKDVVDNCDSMYKLGIVKFGYGEPVYAVELTDKMDRVFSTYQSSKDPDTTATDIAGALNYTAELFKYPKTARIVLVSDALETDGAAKDVVMEFASKGIAVDTVYFPGKDAGNEVQIIDAVPSVPKVEVNTPFNMNLTVESSVSGKATVTPYDNNEAGKAVEIVLKEGKQTISIPRYFDFDGMHVLSFEIKMDGDTVAENNHYYSHIYIETFTEVLIIESVQGESDKLVSMIDEEINVTVINSADGTKMPSTLDELRRYDEIVLVNVANRDLPPDFDQILYEYVHDIGGGLFTVCGDENGSTPDDPKAHAYTWSDMRGTKYQSLLPVEIVEYTPPVGVIIVVDSSGSMLGQNFEKTKLKYALDGARACLDALTERDYVGIMTLADVYTEELALTPRTQRDKILESIYNLEEQAKKGTLPSGGTNFSPALERAGKALAARSDFEKKHIIIVTDGEPSASDKDNYLFWAKENAKLGITMSVVGAGVDPSDGIVRETMEELLIAAGYTKEEAPKRFHPIAAGEDGNLSEVSTVMREDLNTPEIKTVNYEDFVPRINAYGSITNKIKQEDMPTLGGYYGVKLKDDATAVLMGNYSPVYAQWEFGNGRVGTFACNLDGSAWSAEFVSSEVGGQLVNNIIRYLFPKASVRPSDIGVKVSGENYTTTLSIFTEVDKTEKIKVTVSAPDGETQVFDLNSTNYSRLSFATKKSGLHTIKVQKLDADGKEIANSTVVYKTLSYSKEYNAFPDRDVAKALIESLSNGTGGFVIEEPEEVFENAVEYIHVVIDPRIPFAIIIIVLFLIDIAARKFKWKWPHEIWRDKKRLSEQGGKEEVK